MAALDDTGRILDQINQLSGKLDDMRKEFTETFVSQQVFDLQIAYLKDEIKDNKATVESMKERELNKGQRFALYVSGMSGLVAVLVTVLQHLKVI